MGDTAKIMKKRHCSECGWPVVTACANDEFGTYENAVEFDYWAYCSNKGCSWHKGEGYYSGDEFPEFVGENTEPDADEGFRHSVAGR